MAKVFLPPEELELPVFDPKNYEQYKKDMDNYVERVVEWCKKHSKCKDAGEIIDFPVGDGKARYVVFQYSELLWLEEGDCYQIQDAYMRGLRKADIVDKIKQSKAFDKLFKRNRK